jgi:hypothetical protein
MRSRGVGEGQSRLSGEEDWNLNSSQNCLLRFDERFSGSRLGILVKSYRTKYA